MSYIKDFFKSKEDILRYFKGTAIRFSFCDGHLIHYETIIPIDLEDNFYHFGFSFVFTKDVMFMDNETFKSIYKELEFCGLECWLDAYANKETIYNKFKK